MAKGYGRYKERLDILNSFGKNLARRSGSKCELCSASGVKLMVFEVPPASSEPDYDKCVFLCETCQEKIEKPGKDLSHWQCLNEKVWSEVPAVKILSVKILKKAKDESWVHELLEQVYLEPEEEEWVGAE